MAEIESKSQVGKRYRCQVCEAEIICVKAGSSRIACHGIGMSQLQAKPLPASD
jgi:hypothetical protein